MRRMPQVAGAKVEGPLGLKIQELIKAKTNGIASRRELAKRTAAIKQTTLEGERKSVRLHMGGASAEEPSIAAYAMAFNVSRDEFPEATPRPSAAERLNRSVEQLSQQIAADVAAKIPPDLSGPLAALQATVDLQQKTIEALDDRLSALERAYIAAQTPPADERRKPQSPGRKAAGGRS